jgi:hypothetical protein
MLSAFIVAFAAISISVISTLDRLLWIIIIILSLISGSALAFLDTIRMLLSNNRYRFDDFGVKGLYLRSIVITIIISIIIYVLFYYLLQRSLMMIDIIWFPVLIITKICMRYFLWNSIKGHVNY